MHCPICQGNSARLLQNGEVICPICGNAMRGDWYDRLLKQEQMARAIRSIDTTYSGSGSVILDPHQVAVKFGKHMVEDGPLGDALIELTRP